MSDEAPNLETGEKEQQTSTPAHLLAMAVQSATDQKMPMSELIGLLFYYAHSVCATYRDDVIRQQQEMAEKQEPAG